MLLTRHVTARVIQNLTARVIQDILVLFIRLRDVRTHVWPLHSRSPSVYVTLVHTFGRYILVPIRLRDARTYDCHRIFSFIIAVYVTLVHTVFQPVWGSLRLAPTNIYASVMCMCPASREHIF